MAQSNFLVTVEQAGFDILYAFMLADGRADESEMHVIRMFLETARVKRSSLFDQRKPYYSECNFTREYDYLRNLDRKGLKRRLEKAAKALTNWLPPQEADSAYREDLVQYASEVIMADGVVSPEEAEMLAFLGKIWKIDIQPYLKKKP